MYGRVAEIRERLREASLMTVQINRNNQPIKYKDAPSGTYLEIVNAWDESLIGHLVFKPVMSNTNPCLLSKPLTAVTDIDDVEVVPLRTGDTFTITVDYTRWKEGV